LKIDKISEFQIKVTLDKDDLQDFDVNYGDLIPPGNYKSRKLFQKIMMEAMNTHGFNMDTSTRLLMETVPIQDGRIVIVVSKAAEHTAAAGNSGHVVPPTQHQSSTPAPKPERRHVNKPAGTNAASEQHVDGSIFIHSFKSLDEVGAVSARLKGSFRGESSVYKNKNKYYLVLQNHKEDGQQNIEFESVLLEYGQKQPQNIVYKLHLAEYGEVILSDGAVEKLAEVY